MALRLPVSHPSWSSAHHITSSEKVRCGNIGRRCLPRTADFPPSSTFQRQRRSDFGEERKRVVLVRSGLETVSDETLIGRVTEVTKDTFWPIVNGAGDKTVVLDMYTQWCGPCKVIAPKLQELSKQYLDVVFLKIDCNQENKPLAKELGIRVVPTFKILKHGKIIKEVTGAKLDDIVAGIEYVRST